jgi:histidinol dehydrogenase
MRTIFYILCAASIFIFFSCNSNNNNAKVVVMDTVYDYANDSGADSMLIAKSQSLLWHVEDTAGLKLTRPTVQGIDTMSAKNVIALINNNDDSIHVDYIKTSHDTIYVNIPNSEMLTARIGDTGAEMFMASTTFSLTELKGINYVNYNFKEGEHASPGVYDRTYFKALNNN